MAISFKKYVDITSGVGGAAQVRQRELIGRLFTINPLVPVNSFLEFSGGDLADQVGEYFGFTSEEYKRALFYASFISKSITKATKISFARWAKTATAPYVYGNTANKDLATYTAISNGSLNLTMGANTNSLTSIDLSGAANLAAVAALLQTKIRTGTGTQFTTATVTYDATSKRFILTGSSAVDAVMTVNVSGVGTDLAPLLGWTTATDAIISDGSAATSLTETLTESAQASNNFGSYLFQPTLSDAEQLEVAQWNAGQNVAFMACLRVVDSADATQAFADLADYGGVAVTLAPLANEYPEMAPMILLAATDYTRRNAVLNYMYNQFALTESVDDTTDSNGLDLLRCNYYGETQTAGQFVLFYQRGVLMGLATDPTDMNVYANEMWLKDAAGAAILSLLLALNRVSANDTGRSQLITVLQGIVNQALFNGTISVGKALTDIQKLYITQLTGDERAWRQVSGIGYWLNCVMQSYVTQDSRTEYKAVYTLIYSKDDAIRKVEGSHVLI